MGFKEVSDLAADTIISLGGQNRKTGQKNPTSIEGYYLGSRQVADKKKKSGLSYIYTFQTAKGNVGVWGKTDMDRKMQSVTPGHMVRVSFDKMVPTPNGEMYKYKVQFDESNTIEVVGGSETLETAPAEDTTEAYVADASQDDEAQEEDYELQAQLAAEAATRKAKVLATIAAAKAKAKAQ
jgi:hypothetical protein